MPVVIAVQNPNPTNFADVNNGSKVNSIFLRVETVHNSGTWVTIPRVYMIVMKNPANDIPVPYPATVGTTSRRKFVIHQEMMMQTGVSADANSFPRTMFHGVIKLPKHMQRFGIDDRLLIVFALDSGETTATVSCCVQCIYKEYF